ncbi:MAG: DUF1957 domain-containing protein [Myxococcales bacterium]|nr:DUF1957 domain-containing protein [Myxococcales bacterium]
MAALSFALVLHAHLPYVRESEPWTQTERWFHEALWECYLPLVAVLDALAADALTVPFTLSISPPLLSMLGDPVLAARFDAHIGALAEFDHRLDRGRVYGARLDAIRARSRGGPGILARISKHADAGRIELVTSAASHAFLPGFADIYGAVESQLRIGAMSFASLTGRAEPQGRWLPECAIDARVTTAMARAGVRHTVLESTALERSEPRLPSLREPFVTPSGTVCFARDRAVSDRVWSRRFGYPGHAAYREFHRDVGYELPHDALAPFGSGSMTGLKYWAIGAPNEPKPRYDVEAANAQVERDAADFVAHLESRAATLACNGEPESAAPPLVVAAFDAELFGHWWFEGPLFLECVLRRLHASSRVEPVTLASVCERHPFQHVAEPGASSWGRDGAFSEWVGPTTARLWRLVHGLHRDVLAAARRPGDPIRTSEAIRELLQLEASDWPYLIHTGAMRDYAESRIAGHGQRALQWLSGRTPTARTPFLAELEDRALIEAFASRAY